LKKLGLCIAAVLTAALVFTGCRKEDGETVTVQSVSQITGTGSVGLTDRFAGIVSARSENKIKADSQKTILDILVQEGDEVNEGDVLFTYDMEAYELNLEKAQLELDQMKGTLAATEKEKAQLEKEKEKAGADAQLNYTLEIESLATSIREQEYNIALKEKEVGRLTESLEVTQVTAPLSGRVKTVNKNASNGYDDGSGNDALITIVEAGAYRVKGYVNENNVGSMGEGMSVLIRSRLDETVTWSGCIVMIDWENPQSSQSNGNYYGDSSDEMSSSNKYPFYVELNDSEGLLLGQHVYIEQDMGQGTVSEGLNLPEYFLTEIDGDKAAVWAQDKNGKLEKRTVSIGAYDEMTGTYTVLSGLSGEDFIAYPDETLTEGMTCVEFDPNTFEPDDSVNYEEGSYPEDDVYYEDGMNAEDGVYDLGTIEETIAD